MGRYGLFCFGVLVIFGGVGILAGRLKALSETEQPGDGAIVISRNESITVL